MTLFPDEPLNARPSLKTGDSLVVVRLTPELAKWLAGKSPDDHVLSWTITATLQELMDLETQRSNGE